MYNYLPSTDSGNWSITDTLGYSNDISTRNGTCQTLLPYSLPSTILIQQISNYHILFNCIRHSHDRRNDILGYISILAHWQQLELDRVWNPQMYQPSGSTICYLRISFPDRHCSSCAANEILDSYVLTSLLKGKANTPSRTACIHTRKSPSHCINVVGQLVSTSHHKLHESVINTIIRTCIASIIRFKWIHFMQNSVDSTYTSLLPPYFIHNH
jgi:hypothetical protein